MQDAQTRLAAIDIGTNSFHLIVADAKPSGKFTVLGREKEVVRLGEGEADMKHMSAAAMDRGVAALRRFAQIAESHGAVIRAVATSAVREAENQDAFLARVRADVGIDIEVVSGFEEARLIYLGVLQALPVYHKRVLLVDIGGGSTEFLLGKSGAVTYANSLKLGAIRLTNRFFRDKTLRESAVAECRTWLAGELHPIERALSGEEYDVAIGSSGTILNAASIIRGLRNEQDESDDGNMVITRRDLRRVVAAVLERPSAALRRNIPGMDPARADIIVAGMLLLEQIFERLGVKEMLTSKYALREGIVLDTIHKTSGDERTVAHLRDIRKSSVMHLAENCRSEVRHGANVARYALELFDQTLDMHLLGKQEREYLEAAAILHDIGYHISHSLHHQHSYYIIRHSELLGFTEGEKDIIANVARYHRKSHPKDKHENFATLPAEHRAPVQKLAAILRIADGLDRRHKGMFSSLPIERRGVETRIHLKPARAGDCTLEIWGAERRKGLFEEVFRTQVTFIVGDRDDAAL